MRAPSLSQTLVAASLKFDLVGIHCADPIHDPGTGTGDVDMIPDFEVSQRERRMPLANSRGRAHVAEEVALRVPILEDRNAGGLDVRDVPLDLGVVTHRKAHGRRRGCW